MATIHSLPTELLYRILELGSPWPLDDGAPRTTYLFLRRASLVSRAWRGAAQDRLWRKVYIANLEGAELFVERSAEENPRTTSELVLEGSGPGALSKELTARVINACVGLRSLVMRYGVFHWDAMCLPGMAEVTYLDVGRFPEDNPPPPTLPFQLSHLTLCDFPTPPLLKALLQPSLSSLDLYLRNVNKAVPLQALIAIAHQLTTVSLSSQCDPAVLQPFFQACIALSHLKVVGEDDGGKL